MTNFPWSGASLSYNQVVGFCLNGNLRSFHVLDAEYHGDLDHRVPLIYDHS